MASHDRSPHADLLDRLLERHGRTFADEVGITLRDKPAPLGQLMVAAHVLSANLSADLGVRAATALKQEFRTVDDLAAADDDARHAVLVEARFLRKRRTAELLGRAAQHVVDEYGGDLRRLRERADGEPGRVAALVRELPGIGEVGADIFCREVQTVWPSLRPYADERVLATAERLGLPHTPAGLARAAGTDDLAVLGAALVRCERADDADELRAG